MQNKNQILVLLICVTAHTGAPALDFEFYGSLRVHGESVHPDDTTTMDSYTGFRDAYSRLGVKASHGFGEDITGYAQLELPIDVPNLEVQDPWDQDEDIRIAKFGLKGRYGNVAIGQMWLPYYNAIAYPVDMFSSYYSGFATYTTFRKDKTLAYYSPTFEGFSGSIGYSLNNGAIEANGDEDDRFQATLSYDFGDLTLSGGLDNLGGVNDLKIWGGSAAWQATDEIYIGAKFEVHDSDIDSGYGAEGDTATNLFGSYSLGKNTFKLMLADIDNYGETILHLGWDYQYRDDLKFFAEYYNEQETAAITEKNGGRNETCWDCSGGQVVTAGLRFDFKVP